jgi:Ribbon-helix-helix protein, copG family
MSTLLSVRIPNELAEKLDERRRNADLNVSGFVRRIIERELDRPVLDAEPETQSRRHPVLIAQPKASD